MDRVLELVKLGWERTALWGIQQEMKDDVQDAEDSDA